MHNITVSCTNDIRLVILHTQCTVFKSPNFVKRQYVIEWVTNRRNVEKKEYNYMDGFRHSKLAASGVLVFQKRKKKNGCERVDAGAN